MAIPCYLRSGPRAGARRALDAIPASAAILLHLDIDVFRQGEMPAAYFPHTDGLSLSEGAELLGAEDVRPTRERKAP